MPAAQEAPTHAEKTDRLSVISELQDIQRILLKENPRLDKLDGLITKAENMFKTLQTSTLGRIAGLQDEAKHASAQQEWKTWRDPRVVELESIRDKYDEKAGYVPPAPAPAPPDPSEVVKRKINNLIRDIERRITALKLEIQAESDTEVISTAVLAAYKERAHAIRLLIRPELAALYDELFVLLTPDTVVAAEQAMDTNTEEQNKNLDAAMMLLYRKKFTDSSFIGRPLHSSSPDHSLAGSGGESGSSSSRSNYPRYSYPKATPPTFNGDPLKFPQWMQEMKANIVKDQDDAYAIRMMAELSPLKDLPDLYQSQDEAWAHMKDRFANPALVSKQVISKFQGYTARTLEGPTQQAQVVFLHKLLQKTFLTLKIVKQEKQLTHQVAMITKAQDLIPARYAEDFTDLLVREEKKLVAPAFVLEPEDHYKLLSEFLRDLANKLETKHPELLVKRRTDPPPPPRERDRGRNNKGGGGGGGDPPGSIISHVDGAGKKTGQCGSGRHGQTVDDAPAQYQEAIRKAFQDIGPCPCCDAEGHVFENKKGGWAASSSLADCSMFINELKVNQRGDLLMKKGWCFKCLSWKHSGKDCKKEKEKWFCHIKNDKGNICGKMHSNWLHGCTARLSFLQISEVPGDQLVIPADAEEKKLREMLSRDVMLPIVEFQISKTVSTLILLDGGSTNSLITNSLARKLGLRPHQITQMVTLATKEPELMTLNYYGVVFELQDGPRLCVLLGVDRITSSPGQFSVAAAYREFPHLPKGVLDRKAGQVEILLAQDCPSLLPGDGTGRDQKGSLRVFSIPFASGKVLCGHHPDIKFVNPVRDEESLAMNQAKFDTSPSSLLPFRLPSQPDHLNLLDTPSFYEAETLGYSLPPLCTVRPGNTVKPHGKVKPEDFRDNERFKLLLKDIVAKEYGWDNALASIFANRALEIANTMAEWGGQMPEAKEEFDTETEAALQLTTETKVDLVQHTPGLENPADWPTRGNLEWRLMDLDSEYQLGPSYLRLDRPAWNISRSFVSTILQEERKKKFIEPLSDVHMNLLSSDSHGPLVRSSPFPVSEAQVPSRNCVYLAPFVYNAVIAQTGAQAILSGVNKIMADTNRWIKARNTVARCVQFWKSKDPARVHQNPSREKFRQAEWLCQLASMLELIAYLQAKKKRTEQRNPRVSDIVLLKYSQKYSKPGYRYDKVIKTMEDEASLVRDVVVATRSRRIKEKPDEYKPGPMDHQLVSIQRTVLLLPAKDLASLPEPRELHLCEESTEVPGLGPGDAPPRPPVSHSSSSQCASPLPSPPISTFPPSQLGPSSASQEAEVSSSASQEAEDSEVASLSHFINQVVTNTTVDLLEPFLCSDCGVREVVMYSGTF